MPIIINDFEIEVEAPVNKADRNGPASSTHPPQEAPPLLRPEEIDRIERHYRERRLRLKAD